MYLVIYGISWYAMGNQVKYVKILKFSLGKKLIRIGILLIFPCLLYLYFFLSKNLNLKGVEKTSNKDRLGLSDSEEHGKILLFY